MRVEALGHVLGRDPVGEAGERVGREFKVFRLRHLGHGGAVLLQRQAPALRNGREPVRRHIVLAAPLAGEQHAGFLERLAHAGRPDRQRGVGERLAAAAAGAQPGIAVRLLHLAAGEHQRAGGEVDAVVAHHHEDLDAARPVAAEHERGREPGFDRSAAQFSRPFIMRTAL